LPPAAGHWTASGRSSAAYVMPAYAGTVFVISVKIASAVLEREVLLAAHGLCELADDLPVGLATPDRFDCLSYFLDTALAVGLGAVALGKCCRGKDNRCLLCGLGQEQVLDNQKVEFPECFGNGCAVRGEVLAHDVHCLDLAGCCRFDHGGYRKAVCLRDTADIHCALCVCLSAQEGDTGSCDTGIAGEELEVCTCPDKVAGDCSCRGDDCCRSGGRVDLGCLLDN